MLVKVRLRLKHIGFWFLILSFTRLIADDCPVLPTVDGGTVQPYFHGDIQLYEERIDIHLYDDYYKVFVDYTFINHGPEQTVLMGFPGEAINSADNPPQGYDLVNPLLSFKMFDRDNNLVVRKKKALDENELFNKFEGNTEADWFFLCAEVTFAEAEVKKIKNSYLQYYDYWECDLPFREMKYILQTGKLWKDSIHSVVVIIHNHTFQLDLEWMPRQEYDNQGSSNNKTLYNVEISPSNYFRKENQIFLFFENIEPDFDIIIKIPQKFINAIQATSTLYLESFDYSVQNIFDGDSTTVWVEGVQGSGINETITIDFSARFKESISFYKLDSIGIIGGYAKTEDLFRDNNRIKIIAISYLLPEYYPNDFFSESYFYTLDDSMEMQYLRFPQTILTNKLKLTIVDIYLGDKYDDTCIAEVDIGLHY